MRIYLSAYLPIIFLSLLLLIHSSLYLTTYLSVSVFLHRSQTFLFVGFILIWVIIELFFCFVLFFVERDGARWEQEQGRWKMKEGMIEDKIPLRDSIRSNMFTFLLKEYAPVGDL